MEKDLKNEIAEESTGVAGSGCDILVPFNDRIPVRDIEKSIIKRYRKRLWSPFIKGIKEFDMIQPGDKIGVAISGGKDSLLMAKLFQELKRHGQIEFELEFIAMDPGYHPTVKELLIENCKHLDIPIHLYDSQIFEVLDKIAQDNPCYMCAKMRRGSLYAKARELGCNKLALGHHFNDVIETTMLNMLYAGSFKTMLPRLKSSNFEGMELIRPMYHIREKDIERFIQNSGIWPLNCACMVAAKKTSGKRREIKELIEKLKDNFENVDKSIFKATQNVNMDAVIAWEKEGKRYSYLDEF